jgi:hypothetical protein
LLVQRSRLTNAGSPPHTSQLYSRELSVLK